MGRKIQVPYLKFQALRDEDELFDGVKKLVQEEDKHYSKPYRRMLENARDVMEHGQDAVWDFDRDPPVPACRYCGDYLIQPKRWLREGRKGWICSSKYRFPLLHSLNWEPRNRRQPEEGQDR